MSIGNGTKRKLKTKMTVFRRDNEKCIYCSSPLTLETMTLDHFITKGKGGNFCSSNLVLACYKCNQNRGNQTFFEFISKLKVPFSEEKIRKYQEFEIKSLIVIILNRIKEIVLFKAFTLKDLIIKILPQVNLKTKIMINFWNLLKNYGLKPDGIYDLRTIRGVSENIIAQINKEESC